MITLNNLKFNKGSMKSKKRVSRGDSGKSSGRGLKGQKARSGVSLNDFQGGQTPVARRLPKHCSFKPKKTFQSINIKDLAKLVSSNLIKEKELITLDFLRKVKMIKPKLKLKLIDGPCEVKFDVECHSASKSVLEKYSENIKLIK